MYGIEQDEMQLMQDIFSSVDKLEQVVLFGSRAKGTHKPFSDVDITLKGDCLSENDLSEICLKLSESSLPYFFDVSIFNNLSSNSLIDHIKRRGKIIYNKTSH